jgi:methyl-accepting chemotaxis protein
MQGNQNGEKLPATGRKWRFRDLSLRFKLIMAFLAVSLIICGAAGYGIYTVTTISKEIGNVFGTALPLLEGTHKLGSSLQEAQILNLRIIETDDEGKIAKISEAILVQDEVFTKNLERMKEIADKNDLDLGAESEGTGDDRDVAKRSAVEQKEQDWPAISRAKRSGLERVKELHRKFMSDAETMMAAHLKRIKADASIKALSRERFEDFEKQTEYVNRSLSRVLNACETIFAYHEEIAMTRVLIGEATQHELNQMIDRFYDVDYPLVRGVTKLLAHLAEVRETAQAFLVQQDDKKSRQIRTKFEDKLRTMTALVKRTSRRAQSNEIKQGLDKTLKGLEQLKVIVLKKDGIFDLHKQREDTAKNEVEMRRLMVEAATRCRNAIETIAAEADDINRNAKDTSISVGRSAGRGEISIAVIGLGVSLVLGFVISGAVSSPIKKLAEQAKQVSQGDLTIDVYERDSRDELGLLSRSFRLMLSSLTGQIRQTLEGVNVLTASASDISSTLSQLAANISKVSTAVAETTTTVEQVKQSARVASEKAHMVAEASQQAAEISESGSRATQDTIHGMNLIREQMESVGDTVVKLSSHSQEIEAIVGSVQDLSDQSNLLAVNASIEAARAGDQGKGFAVVAHEIKNLADQSRQATDQIRTILDETRKWVSAVVMATEQGTKAVEAGVEQSVLAGEAIQTLASRVGVSSQAASVINVSTDQQFTGVDQVASAMGNIELAMRQSIEGMERLQNATRQLEDLGDQLKQLTRRYTM